MASAWTVTTMPATPGLASLEVTPQFPVSVSISPFTGQQQVQDWGGGWLTAKATLPPMDAVTAAPWITFFMSLRGPAYVFAFTVDTTITEALPASASGQGYWRLKAGSLQWQVSKDKIYYCSFECLEAF
jgi:hypothetical protein